MQENYDFQRVEQEAQGYWNEHQSFEVTEDPNKPKYYCLCMLPYPSGKLHMGHVRNYTIGDVISRYKTMQGFNVLQPMGWDAFGLPAENAAIKNNVAPAKWTYENIDYMKSQLQSLGFGYDWSRELATCRPDYYKWEQWFFTTLVDKGLAYKKMAVVNWDPVEQTVLANEQVDSEGRGWRSGALVERREIPQWFLKITDYADELLQEIDKLEGWPEAVKTMQRNWIGRSEGVEFDFAMEDGSDPIRVYTTRPDTIMGVTYMAVAAEHPVAQRAAADNPQLRAFIEECKATGTSEAAMEKLEKKGMATGMNAIHPVSGEAVPVWVGNFVLMSYGTGAVMSVPGHDQRDWDFAKKYALPIVQVVADAESDIDVSEAAFVSKEHTRAVNSAQFDGLDFTACFEATASHLAEHANGERKVNFRLRDWGVSRQRYWGCPIPVIYDKEQQVHTVPLQDLPVELPEYSNFSGVTSPLKSDESFYKTMVPGSTEPGVRETDTFDTFFESSWYYARYCCPGADGMLDERANYWLPVDQYIGGIEHAVLHLLYSRFFHKLMRDAGLVESSEPFTRLITQGMVVSETFYRVADNGQKEFYSLQEVDLQLDDKGRIEAATLLSDGQPVVVGNIEKMSKSKNNGVDPQQMIDRFGADTVRLFIIFASPPDQSLEWKDAGVEGMHRFLKRLWRQVFLLQQSDIEQQHLDVASLDSAQSDLRRKTHQTISKVTDDLGRRYTFNTAIAAIMELLNEVSKFDMKTAADRSVVQEALRAIVVMLAPITPHICHKLWQLMGEEGAVIDSAWPRHDESALVQDTIELVVQVNGKLRAKIQVPADADKQACEDIACADENVVKHTDGKTIRKVIVVPGRLVNIVAN